MRSPRISAGSNGVACDAAAAFGLPGGRLANNCDFVLDRFRLGSGEFGAGDTSGKNYGICVDLGSTTICMRLVDLSSGRTMGQVSAYNKQIDFGRIS